MIEDFIKKIKEKVNKFMTKIFGASWRTSFYGLMAFAPQIAKPIQDYLQTQHVSEKTLNIVSFVFGILAALYAKDNSVTGGTINMDGEGS